MYFLIHSYELLNFSKTQLEACRVPGHSLIGHRNSQLSKRVTRCALIVLSTRPLDNVHFCATFVVFLDANLRIFEYAIRVYAFNDEDRISISESVVSVIISNKN